MSRCVKNCVRLFLGLFVAAGLAENADANHQIQHIHRVFRERVRDLNDWYRTSRDGIRCEFDRERERIECAMRDARRLCEPERSHRLEVLRHAMDDLQGRYRTEKCRIHDEYECRRDEIHTWFRIARWEATERGRGDVRLNVPRLGWWGHG